MQQPVKSKECYDFRRGHCSFGDKCRFSHADTTAAKEEAPAAASQHLLRHVSHSGALVTLENADY